jgi:hypothetical protein
MIVRFEVNTGALAQSPPGNIKKDMSGVAAVLAEASPEASS